MKQYGAPVSYACLPALILAGFIVTAGCFTLLTDEGPLPRYLNSRAPASPMPTPVEPSVDDESQVPITPDPVETPATPGVLPAVSGTYNPLYVTVLPRDAPGYRTYTFRYRGIDYEVTLPVNQSLYRAANESANRNIIIDSKELGVFYSRMADDPAMRPFYDDISRELGRLRYRDGKTLLDDEYLEFLVSFVQQIPTESVSRTPRYPVEVVYDMKGTPEEKAILLANLLAHEGYDTALLVFPGKQHAAAGVRIHLSTRNPFFRIFSDGKRDYMYIDSSANRLIGMYPDGFDAIPEPVVIPLGEGAILYTKIDTIATIMHDLKTIKINTEALQEKADKANGTLSADDYAALQSYVTTYNFVISTNDRLAALEAIQESELPHHSACLSCN
ncbi:MAG: hypothetical protein A4E35_01105 [Methanoregula sp. PtaU1.Bin051]|nr:MAG: hypothetical protein A4E35_01105 [Methanoregula sp. PtaU1.Bin051]